MDEIRKEVKILSNIKCNVTECQYNREVQCDAPMIHVNRDGNLKKAQNSDNTKCETFKLKS